MMGTAFSTRNLGVFFVAFASVMGVLLLDVLFVPFLTFFVRMLQWANSENSNRQEGEHNNNGNNSCSASSNKNEYHFVCFYALTPLWSPDYQALQNEQTWKTSTLDDDSNAKENV